MLSFTTNTQLFSMFNLTFRHHVGNLGRPSTRRYDLWASASPVSNLFLLQVVLHSSALPPPWVRPLPWPGWPIWSKDPGPMFADVWPPGFIKTQTSLVNLPCPCSHALQLMAGRPRSRCKYSRIRRASQRTATPRACSAMSLLAARCVSPRQPWPK